MFGGVLAGPSGGGGGGGASGPPAWIELESSDLGALVDPNGVVSAFETVSGALQATYTANTDTLIGYDHDWPYRAIKLSSLTTETDLHDMILEIGIKWVDGPGDSNQAGPCIRLVEDVLPDNSSGFCFLELGAHMINYYSTATATGGLGASLIKTSIEWVTYNIVWQRNGGGYTMAMWDTSNDPDGLGPFNGDMVQLSSPSRDPDDWSLHIGVGQRSGGVAPSAGETQRFRVFYRVFPRSLLRSAPA